MSTSADLGGSKFKVGDTAWMQIYEHAGYEMVEVLCVIDVIDIGEKGGSGILYKVKARNDGERYLVSPDMLIEELAKKNEGVD